MRTIHSLKHAYLLLGDLCAFFGSLFLMLYLRYGENFYARFEESHALPFSILALFWLLVFFVVGLYDVRRLRNGLEFFQTLFIAFAANAVLSLAFFYLVPFFGVAPKTNLVIFLLIFGILFFLWRRHFNGVAVSLLPAAKVILAAEGPAADELSAFLAENRQLGYEIVRRIPPASLPTGKGDWRTIAEETGANLLVVPYRMKNNPTFGRTFFDLLELRMKVRDLPGFYESVFRKVPLAEIDEEWLLEHVSNQPLLYNDTKRIAEFLVAYVALIVLLPLEAAIALLVKLTSRGPVIYRQVRVGKYGKHFVFYKFRTMREDAEKHGPQWAAVNDSRITPVGRILRYTHLDELPQLFNILKGDLSFVGPRPERPEFTAKLREQIPFYEVRTFLKPGVTGWAQIHQRADLTVEDVKKKLEYDLYYVKNRSLILDFVIILKTLKTLFSNH